MIGQTRRYQITSAAVAAHVASQMYSAWIGLCTSSFPAGTSWKNASAIAAYAVKWSAYQSSYFTLRRANAYELAAMKISRIVPTVAMIIPGKIPSVMYAQYLSPNVSPGTNAWSAFA